MHVVHTETFTAHKLSEKLGDPTSLSCRYYRVKKIQDGGCLKLELLISAFVDKMQTKYGYFNVSEVP